MPLTAAAAFFLVLACRLSEIDLRQRLLPDRILLPSLLVSLVLLLLASAADPEACSGRLIAAGVSSSGSFALLHLIRPEGLGLGDVKLAALLGVYLGYLGWPQVVSGLALGLVAGGVAGAWLLIRAGRAAELPFAPFMFAGAAGPLFFPAG